jgi:hypothetical protein
VPLGAGERPTFEHATLGALCREASDIGAQLALAHAMALTFRRAVRDYIPVDDLDITPCLSAGVIDVLDAQVHRLDTLRDHLTRAFYTAYRTPGPTGSSSSECARAAGAAHRSPLPTRAVDPSEAAFGDRAVRRTL